MATHALHPDSHAHGLADGCPRCDEHAAHPFESLDGRNLLNLLIRTERGLPPRSENEAQAMQTVQSTVWRAQMLLELKEKFSGQNL